jgi:hypothetical protein
MIKENNIENLEKSFKQKEEFLVMDIKAVSLAGIFLNFFLNFLKTFF